MLTPEELHRHRVEAGRKGGLARVPKGFSMNRELARQNVIKNNLLRKRRALEAKSSPDE